MIKRKRMPKKKGPRGLSPADRLVYYLHKEYEKKGYKDFEQFLARETHTKEKVLLKVLDKVYANKQHTVVEQKISPEQLEMLREATKMLAENMRKNQVEAKFTILEEDEKEVG